MKRCPVCAVSYFDDSLEFCLEDGSRLALASHPTTYAIPNSYANKTIPLTEKFSVQPIRDEAETIQSHSSNKAQNTEKKFLQAARNSLIVERTFEITPVIFALAHNWWQWLYAANQPTTTVSGFLLSINFAVWFLLLAVGATFGLLAVKRCQNKNYAYISLIVLATNLILFIVPRR
jgi:hypothetical protein